MDYCKAELHSKDGLDSLPYSNHTLFCNLQEGHRGEHKYFGFTPTYEDNSKNCDCPRCIHRTTNLENPDADEILDDVVEESDLEETEEVIDDEEVIDET